MYFFNGFVFGGEPKGLVRVEKVKALPDQMLLVTFNNHEERLFDASVLKGPAIELLLKQDIFSRPEIDHGVVTWNNGLIDCAPEYMYEHSYEYVEADKLHV